MTENKRLTHGAAGSVGWVLRRLDLCGLTGPLADRLPRPRPPGDGPVVEVREILDLVRQSGDAALRELTTRFDGVDIGELTVPEDVVAAAVDRIPASLARALEQAAANIGAYHEAQMPSGGGWWSVTESESWGCIVPSNGSAVMFRAVAPPIRRPCS